MNITPTLRYTDPSGYYVQDYNGTAVGSDFVTDVDTNNEYNSCSSWCDGSIERDGILVGAWNAFKNWNQSVDVEYYNSVLGSNLKSYYDLEKLRLRVPEIDDIVETVALKNLRKPWEIPEFQVLITVGALRLGAFPNRGGYVIGRQTALETPGTLRPGERFLDFHLGSTSRATYKANMGALRKAMNMKEPIRDATPSESSQFLNAERSLLESRGWNFDGTYYNPPF